MHNLAVGIDIYFHCRKYQQLETKMNFYDGNLGRSSTLLRPSADQSITANLERYTQPRKKVIPRLKRN